jgi:hypothetical protein
VAHIRKKQSFKEDYDNASGVYGRALNYLKRKQLSSAQISCNKALRILRDSNPADDKDAEKKKMFQETVSGLKNKIQSAIRRKLRKIKS